MTATATTCVSKAALKRAMSKLTDWFEGQGWKPFRFQKQVWTAWGDSKSGLVHASTGTGKTYSGVGGTLIHGLAEQESAKVSGAKQCRLIWVTPLRALADDLAHAIRRPVEDLGLNWRVETRTGDTSASVKNRQRTQLPEILITTPESLTLLLTQNDARTKLSHLQGVVADEWHELLSTKRGVQLELALARLKRWNTFLRIWGLSATIGNLPQAMEVLLGDWHPQGMMIDAKTRKDYRISSYIPETIERFPWAGHLGLNQSKQVAQLIDNISTALVFTNTRAQSELWYQAILRARPEWAGQMAIHHGSLEQDVRRWVEAGLREGTLKCVVCTSSLDLGVDFSPVERVIQVGSPKGIARLMQRAGRCGHSPGEQSEVICVPTHALELVEIAAAREAVHAQRIESRIPAKLSIDVLVQHIGTIALGGGFQSDDLLDEVRSTYCYRQLTNEQWDWAVEFARSGGQSLKAYPMYHRLEQQDDGTLRMTDRKKSRQHRMNIGTIVSDGLLKVQFQNGGRLGSVEEWFVSRLKPGDQFVFAGRSLELIRIREMTVWVKMAKKQGKQVPRWMGGRMPLSTELSQSFLRQLQRVKNGEPVDPEVQAVMPILVVQQAWSALPGVDHLLVESIKSREGYHLFFFPFAGRLVHEGLSALVAYRIAQLVPISFTFSVNDYGFELLSPVEAPLAEAIDRGLLSTNQLRDDLTDCMNSAEMAKRQFREIARIAGLIFQGFPGQQMTAKQVQASSGLLYDVFENYDPENLLLQQAKREVLDRQLEYERLHRTLEQLDQKPVQVTTPPRMTPFAFPLFVDRLRAKLSSEKLEDRVRRMTMTLEKGLG